MSAFDPYHKWLGIPPEEQPANHYRLLGITLFEGDPDVIADAADRQMVHVRSHQAGEHSAISQQILNEISAARVCLLNAEKKAAYDEQLRKQVNPLADLDFLARGESERRATRASKKRQLWIGVGSIGAAVVVLIVVLAVTLGRNANDVASTGPKSPSTPPDPTVHKPAKPEPKAKSKPQPKPTTGQKPKPEPKPESKPEPKPEEETEPVVGPKPEPTPEPKSGVKLAIPDDAAQQKGLAIIREVYKDQYKDKPALARRLLDKALETNDDPVARFVFLLEARDLAFEAKDSEFAFRVVDAIAENYNVSGPEMKAGVLEKAAKRPRLLPSDKLVIAQAALEVTDEALAEDNFELAKRLGRQASQLARSTRETELLQKITAKNKEVEAAARAYAEREAAMAVLKDKPTDPDANLTVGKYLCFTSGDWKKGLPMLALGSDAALKALAEKDIVGAASVKEQVALGDSWWEVNKERADDWYEQALPGLTGLEKARVEKRMRQTEEVPAGRKTPHAKQWSLVRDFSPMQNPNKCWSYGQTPGLAGEFALLTKLPEESFLGWKAQPETRIAVNPTRNTMYGVLPGELCMHPSNTVHAVSRWIAPIRGRVSIKGKFGAGDSGLVDVYVLHKGKVLCSALNTPKDEPFTLEIRLQKGDTIDFVVGAGRNGHAAGATPVEAVIILK